MTREEAIKWIGEHNNPFIDETKDSQAYQLALGALRQPQIVRCKDCKWNSGYGRGMYVCFCTCCKTGTPHKDDWFCADGEPKEGDEE